MSTSINIELPQNYKARDYQAEALHALQTERKKRAVWVWHRRAGKDKTALAGHMIPEMVTRVGNYYHWFPTATLGRKAIWQGKDKEGMPFIEHFPKQLIAGKPNEQLMQVKFINGSIYQIVGTDRMDVVGPGPVGNIFSEYALQSPKGWDYARPILAENDGWAIFCYTPRGKNHGHDLYKMAMRNTKWYCKLLTVDDTKAISKEAIEDDRRSGMSEDMIQQEYYCSFELGAEGAFFAKALAEALDEGRVCNVRHDPYADVQTFWDLGIGGTAVWFVQFVRQEVHLIDYYEWYGQDISHYANVVDARKTSLKYKYGNHFVPPDVHKKELATKSSTFEQGKQLGLDFSVLKKEESVYDGINRTLGMLPHCYFDAEKCSEGIKALENYHKEYNEKFKVYAEHPCKDWSSHGADALRYVSMIWKKGGPSKKMTAEEAEEIWDRHRRPY